MHRQEGCRFDDDTLCTSTWQQSSATRSRIPNRENVGARKSSPIPNTSADSIVIHDVRICRTKYRVAGMVTAFSPMGSDLNVISLRMKFSRLLTLDTDNHRLPSSSCLLFLIYQSSFIFAEVRSLLGFAPERPVWRKLDNVTTKVRQLQVDVRS